MKTDFSKAAQKKTLIIAGVGALAFLVFSWLVFLSPLKSKINEVDKELTVTKQKLAEATSIADNKEALERELILLQHKLAYVSEMLPQKKEIPKLLKTITTKANETGIKINSFRPSAVISKGFYNEVPVELNVRTTYNNLGLFFAKIGNLNRVANVESVQISPLNAEKGRETITATLVIKTFTYTEGGGI